MPKVFFLQQEGGFFGTFIGSRLSSAFLTDFRKTHGGFLFPLKSWRPSEQLPSPSDPSNTNGKRNGCGQYKDLYSLLTCLSHSVPTTEPAAAGSIQPVQQTLAGASSHHEGAKTAATSSPARPYQKNHSHLFSQGWRSLNGTCGFLSE